MNQNIGSRVCTKQQRESSIRHFESNLPNESFVLEFGMVVQRNGRGVQIVTDLEFPEKSDYGEQTPVLCSPDPHYLARMVLKYSKQGKVLLGIWHRHGIFGLSTTDMHDGHMCMLNAGFRDFVTGYYNGGVSAFYQYDDGFKEIKSVVVDTARFDRQMLAYGYERQMLISSTRVLVVGCSGGGFPLANYLALKGYLLDVVDPDVFTKDSLNRVWIPQKFVGDNKAVATKKLLEPFTDVKAHPCKFEDLPDEVIKDSDIIVVFTDSVTSRLLVNQKAVEFGKPAVFLGSEIRANPDGIEALTGTCLVYTKGAPCYNCNLHVDPNQIQRETLSPEMWKHFAKKYGQVEDLPSAPSIVELNSMVASIGADQVTRLATGYASPILRQYVDLLHGKIFVVNENVNKECIHCAEVKKVEVDQSNVVSFDEIFRADDNVSDSKDMENDDAIK